MKEVKTVAQLIQELNKQKVTNQVELCDYCDREKPLTDFERIHGFLTIYPDKSWTLIGVEPYRCKECAQKGLTKVVER